ncbi:MAG: hypothetical protein GXO48_05910 [Chlorobi bacterium]|nr:hypothetical protein [Chlorobiota bacterium]
MKPEDYTKTLQLLKAEWETLKTQLTEDYEDLRYLQKRVKDLDRDLWLVAMGKHLSIEKKKELIVKINSYISTIKELRKIILKQISSENE